jgi:hypothetical protein
MKRILLLLAFIFIGCTSDKPFLFDMDIEAEIEVGAGLNTLDTHYFLIRRVPTRIQTYLTGLDESIIGEILPRRAEIIAPFDNIDFGIVQEVSIWAVSITDSELRKEIFYQDRINLNDQKELRLFSSLSEVKDILLNDHVDLEVRFKFRAFTPTQIETRLIMNFLVNGKE